MEFLLDRSGNFYFMEMNTRLQVEHAVTEAITGLDLVEWQLRVASGEPLPFSQASIVLDGHAIEVRLTAEDVAAGFLPQGGAVLRWRPPGDRHDVRVDHGLREGGTVPPHYDSMVAKLVAHGRTREEARRKLLSAVQDCVLLGVESNQRFLADCLAHPVFAGGEVHTGFIAQHMGEALAPPCPDVETIAIAALCAAGLPEREPLRLSHTVSTVDLELGKHRWRIELEPAGDGTGATVWHEAQPHSMRLAIVRPPADGVFWIECGAQVHKVVLARDADGIHLFVRGRAWRFRPTDPRRARVKEAGSGAVTAPLTGRIAAIHVGVGDVVSAGQALMVMEAMKMEHTLTAPFAGQVTELSGQVGALARAGGKLVHVQAVTEEEPA